MTSDPQRAQALFLAALELSDSAARRKLLERECAGDESLRQRVEALLCAHDATGGFDVEPSGQAFQATIDAPLSMHPGTLVAGRYKLLEPIGEGGMGTVWLAEQKEPVKRKVAIKLVKAGMDSRQVLARFEAERQALALMDHPNIAKVFDGGMTEQGRPFFVMEYVKGVPLTEYCDQARLSLKERLQLFMPVCQAVQHAHQKGIIHRDLKPSNILICLYDGNPVPKVIDFGLAKAMHHSLTDQSLYTAHGMMVGTPLYMSPEQAEHNNLDVDTRTDIYSLGVILYELLTGTTPLERQQMKQAAYNEILRLIKEVEPPKPSTRLSGSASLPSIAAQRSIDPRQLRKSLAGDLDWIVMKALDKERSRRYETANGLSRDIERFLHDEAVDACPPSSAYRLKKFIHRNRPQVIAASLVLLALLGGVVGTSVGLYQANMARNAEAWQRELAEAREREANDERAKAVSAAEQERQAKEREAQRAEGERLAKLAAETAQKQAEQAAAKEKAANAQAQKRLAQVEKGNEILASIFNDLDIYQIKQGSEPLETVLAERLVKAAGQLENESVGDPTAVAALQIRLGDSLLSLGKNQEAVKLLEKARQTCMPLLGSEHEYLALRAMNSLSVAYERSMDYARALPLTEELLKLSKVKHGVKHPNTLAVMNSLAFIYNSCGKSSEAIPIYEDVLEIQRAISGEKDKATLIGMTNLGGAYKNARKLDLAQPLLEKALGLMQENLGAAHSFTLNCATHLGEVYMALGRADLGVPLLEETVELSKKHQGSAHPDTLARINALATAYQRSGKLDQAVTLFEEVLETGRATLGPESPQTIITMHNLAVAYNRDGNRAKAIALLEQALPLLRKKLGLDNSNTLITMGALAALYKDTGQFELALSLYEEHLKLRKARRECPASHGTGISGYWG